MQLLAERVDLGAGLADHDAGPGGVDVHPHPVPGPLDLDLGDAGPLHALGEQLADGDVLTDADIGAMLGFHAARRGAAVHHQETVRRGLVRAAQFGIADHAFEAIEPGACRGATLGFQAGESRKPSLPRGG